MDVMCAQIYKQYIAFIKVCWDTKQCHGGTGLTMIFSTVVKNIDKHWNTSLFHCKANKKRRNATKTRFSTIQPSIDVTGIKNERWQ